MQTNETTTRRRLTLLPVEERTHADRPVIRRYKLARVVDDLGTMLAPARQRALQTPASGVRAP